MSKSCGHHHLSSDAVRELLSDRKINRTKVKIKILQELAKSTHPLSVPEIHSLIKEKCDVSTVFRSVSQFKEKGLVNEVNLEEGFFRYEFLPNQLDHEHHHHIRCRNCGDIRHLEKCDLSTFEIAIAKLGFSAMEHRLEFSGLCSKCSRT